jgi:hypothetical protein
MSRAAVGYSQLFRDEVPLADAVLALCVEHDDLAVAEAQLAQDVGLLERRLAVAGLAEHQPVGRGELLAVQLEGVVDVALPGVDLASDDDARVAEAGCGGRQVDRLGLARGGAHGQAGRLDLAEEEAREGVCRGGQRIPHQNISSYLRIPVANGSVLTKARWCSRSHHSSFRYDFPAEARMVRLSRARASGERELTVM